MGLPAGATPGSWNWTMWSAVSGAGPPRALGKRRSPGTTGGGLEGQRPEELESAAGPEVCEALSGARAGR
ncbi:hypothetical protein NDU88_004002 [Pleurodeles waltl]|uniref:Uncharacterized protein n=1 Tax=Pleurodeles waltl TaxID=8319 RepID=A0AAV7LK48_PLEWA|nr:hypothetical protein NDU88_004002 [Pleurodeles waltl]